MERRYSHSSCLISVEALRKNVSMLRGCLNTGSQLGLVVKSEAYGHGLDLVVLATADLAEIFLVQTVDEALRVRALAPEHRVIVVGPTPRAALSDAAANRIELTLPFAEDISSLEGAARDAGRPLVVHLKAETGTHRQGMEHDALLAFTRALAGSEGVVVQGVSTHFADIEDTLDHGYALEQFSKLKRYHADVQAASGRELEFHCANSAATLLKPQTHGAFVRCGIASYGLWPSRETLLSVRDMRAGKRSFELDPVMTWKATVTQVKRVRSGSFISYGRTYRATADSEIAVLGLGYADGYDRLLSNCAHGILRGIRVPVRGRICMNMTMVDVTDVEGCERGSEVTLLGSDGGEEVSADQIAAWAGTINYEIPTRIAADIPRIAVNCPPLIRETLEKHGVPVSD